MLRWRAGMTTRHRVTEEMKSKRDEYSAFPALQLNKAKMAQEIVNILLMLLIEELSPGPKVLARGSQLA